MTSLPMVILGLLITPIIILSGLNYSGFCMQEGRWFSDEEMKIRMIEEMMRVERVAIRTKDRGIQYYYQIKYDSVDEFLKENPDCCEKNPTTGPGELAGEAAFTNRITGTISAGDIWRITYKARYVDENRKLQSQVITSQGYRTNCGKAFEF